MCCVSSNKRLLKLINHQSGDEILRRFQILFIALFIIIIILINYPLEVLCYKMNKTFLFFFYQTFLCHSVCLKMPDTGSSISKPLLKKEKRITLSFKMFLSAVSGVTAQIFFPPLCNLLDKENHQSRSDPRLMQAGLQQLAVDSTSCVKGGDKKFHS